jgi:hypothetical protein
MITDVVPDSRADKAGLRPVDVNRTPVAGADGAAAAIRQGATAKSRELLPGELHPVRHHRACEEGGGT